jgi:hypothetical protein
MKEDIEDHLFETAAKGRKAFFAALKRAPTETDGYGHSFHPPILTRAIHSGNLETVRLVLAAGVKKPHNGGILDFVIADEADAPLIAVVESGRADMLRLMLIAGYGPESSEPLLRAVELENSEAVALLVTCGHLDGALRTILQARPRHKPEYARQIIAGGGNIASVTFHRLLNSQEPEEGATDAEPQDAILSDLDALFEGDENGLRRVYNAMLRYAREWKRESHTSEPGDPVEAVRKVVANILQQRFPQQKNEAPNPQPKRRLVNALRRATRSDAVADTKELRGLIQDVASLPGTNPASLRATLSEFFASAQTWDNTPVALVLLESMEGLETHEPA